MSGSSLTLDKIIAAPPARLWAVLVRPDLWWGPDVALDARPGGVFREPWRDAAGAGHLTLGTVADVEPGRLLVISWADEDWDFATEVRFDMAPQGAGSALRLTHAGWERAPDGERAELIAAHEGGWAFHLDNLKAAAERS